MNSPVSAGIANALFTAPSAGVTAGGSPQCFAENVEGIDFSQLLSSEKLMPELMELLKSRIPPEDFARLEEMLESGNDLPLPAILGLFQEVLANNPAPTGTPVEEVLSNPLPDETAGGIPPGGRPTATAEEALSRLLQMSKHSSARENPSLSGQTDVTGAAKGLSPEDQEALKDILRQVSAMRPAVSGEAVSTTLKPAGVGSETLLTAAANLEAGVSGGLQSPAVAGVVSNLSSTPTSGAHQTPPAITIPPGDKGWDQAMGERILWMVGRDLQAASVNIKPPHLGPLNIQISIQNDQASVNFTAQHGVVKDALEAAIPRLREMLAENNIQLVNVDVSHRDPGGRGETADLYQGRRDGNPDQYLFSDDVESEAESTLVHYYRSDGLLDDYA